MALKVLTRLAMGLAAFILLAAAGGYLLARASLPDFADTTTLSGLSAPAQLGFDAKGIPRIVAARREDAFRVLGVATARDRLFQMDLLRRHAAGRLAEILGPALLEADSRHRLMGFEQVAERVWASLPADQKAVLTAYAEGVNEAVAGLPVLPPEFLALAYRFTPWRPQDSLLVVLGMEETLTWSVNEERMATVMEAALPGPLYAFLTPPIDPYTARLLSHDGAALPARPPLPRDALLAILKESRAGQRQSGLVAAPPLPQGSNGWVVGSAKTWDGRAILANDMHLRLGVPNIWYRAELRYGTVALTGFTLPGVPLLIAGSNGRVAWGFTSTHGDFTDLVRLDIDPNDAGRYRTLHGYARFGERAETIPVRGGTPRSLRVRTTEWGPVLPDPLLGQPVALRWTALDPAVTDLGLMKLDDVRDVPAALAVFNRAGGPPLNALVADAGGHIGWTYSGKIPKRFGLDGLASRDWADGTRGWDGYIPPEQLPRRIDPAEGFIVNANQRMVDDRYPHVIGTAFDNGHRAHRIAERLAGLRDIGERDMFELQLDTRAAFFRFYQRLALSLLRDDQPGERPLKDLLQRWDGHAERDSQGLAVLLEFRRRLIDAVVSPYLARCRTLEPQFAYRWLAVDEPVQQLLAARLPELLPDPERYPDWEAWLRETLLKAAEQAAPLWGEANRVAIAHPLSAALPGLGAWLDMPREPVAGCSECVRSYRQGGGASERLVVAPGHEATGILHMPGGQSGHPLSPHYRDQQRAWLDGLALPLEAGPAVRRVEFLPGTPAASRPPVGTPEQSP